MASKLINRNPNAKPRGSAPGERRGGRQKGTPNKRTAVRKQVEELTKQYGVMPLEFLIEVMKDKNLPLAYRIDAAKSAAPYTAPKLATIVHKGDISAPLVTANMSKKEFQDIATKVVKDI